MADNKVTITAAIKAKAGMEEKAKQALMSIVGPTRAEKGCIEFDLFQVTDDKTCFMFYEKWTSKEALDAHMQAPHIKAFGGKAGEFLAEPIKATFWGQVL